MTETLIPQEEYEAGLARQRELEEFLASPDAPEQESTPDDYVESFVDKNGVERSAENPLVLLNAEAREAVESYFDDHNSLMSAIDEQLDDLGFVRTAYNDYQDGETVLGMIQRVSTSSRDGGMGGDADRASVFRVLGLEYDPSSAEETQARDSLSESERELVETDDKVKGFKSKEQLVDGIIRSHNDIASIDGVTKEVFERLVESLTPGLVDRLNKMGVETDLGIRTRFSSGRREEAAGNILRALSELRTEARAGRESTEEVLRERIVGQILGVIQENVDGLEVQASTVSEGGKHLINRETEDISTVLDAVGRHGEELSEASEQMEKIETVDSAIKESLSDSLLGELIHKLPEDKQTEVFKALLEGLRTGKVISADTRSQVHEFMEATGYTTLSNSAETLGVATQSVYAEEALPVDYVSEAEKEKLQELYDKYSEITSVVKTQRGDESVGIDLGFKSVSDHIKEVRGRVEKYRGDKILYHGTQSVKEIIESGSLMTIEEQARRQNRIVIHTGKNGEGVGDSGLEQYRHSTVVHFGSEIIENYLRGSAAGRTPGVVALPVSEIIKYAPIDRKGYVVEELPIASGVSANTSDDIFHNHSDGTNIMDDYTFFASEDVDEADDYALPIASGYTFAVPASMHEETGVDVPQYLSDRVSVMSGKRVQDLHYGDIRRMEREAEAHLRTGDSQVTFVVPLRRSALPLARLETPVKDSGQGGYKVDIGGATVTRA